MIKIINSNECKTYNMLKTFYESLIAFKLGIKNFLKRPLIFENIQNDFKNGVKTSLVNMSYIRR